MFALVGSRSLRPPSASSSHSQPQTPERSRPSSRANMTKSHHAHVVADSKLEVSFGFTTMEARKAIETFANDE